MIEPDGSMGNLIVAVVGVVITMIIAFIATMILYKDDPKKNAEVQTEDTKQAPVKKEAGSLLNASEIVSPMSGKVLKLENIQDDAFASGVLGKELRSFLPKEPYMHRQTGKFQRYSQPFTQSE